MCVIANRRNNTVDDVLRDIHRICHMSEDEDIVEKRSQFGYFSDQTPGITCPDISVLSFTILDPIPVL